jgi:hypothetical protein
VEKGDGNPANEKRLCRLGRLAGVTILRLLLAVDQSIGWPMLARDSGKQIKGHRGGGGEGKEAHDEGVFRPEAATTNTPRTSGRPPSNPTRARGLKMLALNSSILVAAPRWRRLLCLLSHLAPAHRQGVQLSGARHPAPSVFWLFDQAQEKAAAKRATGSSPEAQS